MDKRNFLTYGFLLINLHFMLTLITAYLMLSKIHPSDSYGEITLWLALALPISFGILLYQRFKTTGLTWLVLIFTLFIFSESYVATLPLTEWYSSNVIFKSDLNNKMYKDIALQVTSEASGSPWGFQRKLEWILIMMPSAYIGYFGVYVTLFLGSLGPDTFSKTKIVVMLEQAVTRIIKQTTRKIWLA